MLFYTYLSVIAVFFMIDRGTTTSGLYAKSDALCVHDIKAEWHGAGKGAFVACAPLNIGK